ncbi:something about silencing, SAS, complex subunit 4-domain-containing protein [Aspergillus floccosus]
MAMRSRSTLRVPVRREEDHDDSSNVDSQPPLPRPRRPSVALATSSPHRPRRRRQSSPDLLDTTTPDLPRRTSTRLSNAPENHHHTPPLSKGRLLPRHVTPTATTTTTTTTTPASSTPPTSIFLRGGARESPDPLDTISPATSSKRPSGPTPSSVPRHPHHQKRPALAPTESSPPRHGPVARTNARPSTERAPINSPKQHPPHSLTKPTPASTSTPTSADAAPEQRRSLRSHDGASRGRSELALYFPNYEQLLSLEPPKPEFLTGNTTIRLINDLTEPPDSALTFPDINTDTPFGNPLLHLHNCETITLPSSPHKTRDHKPRKQNPEDEDPLNEATYFRAHRRNERQEKQLRNIERDRAQHEKQQLDRLLDELQSQDWPRVMGIGTLTDPEEKKQYETKRALFVKEISALLQKFKIWKEEEKRRKTEKERLAALQPIPDQPPTTKQQPKRRRDGSRPANKDSDSDSGRDHSSPGAALSDANSYGEHPDINDVDALAARQLLQEARSATIPAKKKPKPSSSSISGPEPRKKKGKGPATPEPPPRPPTPPPDDTPFTSFYAKPHLRETALSAHRKGRVRFAFGHPIPDMEEKEFELPAELLTPEAIDACRRKRRRMKRASRTGE